MFEHRQSSPFQHSLSQQCSPWSKQVYSGAGLLGVYLGNSICQAHFWISSLSVVVCRVVAGSNTKGTVGCSEEHARGFLGPTNLRMPHRIVARIHLHPVVADVRQVGRRHCHWSWSRCILFDLDKVFIHPIFIHLEVIAEVLVAEADSAVVTFPKHAMLPFLTEDTLVRGQRDIVTTLLIFGAPTPSPREAEAEERQLS